AVTGTGTAVHGLAGPADLVGRGDGGPAFDTATALTGRDMRNKDRGSRLAIRAAGAALAAAGLLDASGRVADPEGTAVVVSSNFGNLGSVVELADTIAAETVTGLNPLRLPETACSVIAAWVAIRFGLRGPSLTVCNGTSGGLDALFWASSLLATRRARAVTVIGVEPTNDAVRRLLGADSVDGAVAVVLETAEAADERGGPAPAAFLTGYGRGPDAAGAIAATGLPGAGGRHDLGLWLTEVDRPDGALSMVRTSGGVLGLERRLGRCSGALGVLQCAAAAAHLSGGGTGPVLATAGGAGEPVAAVLLTGADATPAPLASTEVPHSTPHVTRAVPTTAFTDAENTDPEVSVRHRKGSRHAER
ncbi:beta-ketoacyl synthase N-terminal-like domain-containing protein, partial [Actinacidiphila rubida]